MSKYSKKLCKDYPTVWAVYKATNIKMAKKKGRDLQVKAAKRFADKKLMGGK